MTYDEILKNPNYEIYEYRYAVGYISRKIDVKNQPVLTAGGHRKGQLYVNIPNWNSTRYHFRLYFREVKK